MRLLIDRCLGRSLAASKDSVDYDDEDEERDSSDDDSDSDTSSDG